MEITLGRVQNDVREMLDLTVNEVEDADKDKCTFKINVTDHTLA